MEWLKKLVVSILGLFGLSTLLSARKSQEVKELEGVIKEHKKKEKEVAKEVKKLQVHKNKNKKEITSAKRKLTRTQNEIKKMEVTYENDDVEDAADFLGCAVGTIVKSLVFRADDTFLICLVAGDKRCSLNKLKKIISKKDVSMANADEVKINTGFSIGGVAPIALIIPNSFIRSYVDIIIVFITPSPAAIVNIKLNNVLIKTDIFSVIKAIVGINCFHVSISTSFISADIRFCISSASKLPFEFKAISWIILFEENKILKSFSNIMAALLSMLSATFFNIPET